MNVRTTVRTSVRELVPPYALPILLVLGLVARLLFIRAEGFTVDIQTFVAWTLSLLDHGLGNFYAKTSFADYPPGYFYILALIGHLWAPFRQADPGYTVLRILVKLPAILADLGVGWLLAAIGRRLGAPLAGLGAAALYLFSPATIFISADWGQVDSIAGGLALLGVYALLRSSDEAPERLSRWIPGAWIALAYSLLIKPQAAVLIPFFIAFAAADRARLQRRAIDTAIGIGAAFVFAYVLVFPFHPAGPIDAFRWLIGQYKFGSSVYDYNSVNAFNLWALHGQLWIKDSTPIGYVVQAPMYVWGIGLVVAATALLVWRYVQERTPQALLESSMLALLAFFVLATRMHERYSFDAVLFCTACIPIARRYLWTALLLTVVLFANLMYSLQYLQVVTNGAPGVDAHNLWPGLAQFYAAIAVMTFFYLGYVFLGSGPEQAAAASTPLNGRGARFAGAGIAWQRVRTMFDPSEGLSVMRAVDWIAMSALGVFSFVLSFINYWYPPGKIFDEIYFARAAEEYLKNMRIYENTHPPFSKLLVTLSVMLFGGLKHGDNAYGWRFLDVVFGALVVMLLYAFAKRMTGSTLFASIASFLLICDGMHFVQSRIATPEGFVVVFSLAAVYAFYRFLIAAQVEERVHTVVPPWAYGAALATGLAAGAIVVAVWDAIWHAMRPSGALDRASSIIIALYVALGVYLLLRYICFRAWFADGAIESTFPDGSYALARDGGVTLYAPDGGTIESTASGKPKMTIGSATQNRAGALVYQTNEYALSYRPVPSVTLETGRANATYEANEIRSGDARESGRSASLWLVLFTVALGLLVSSKWYGVMGFGVSFTALIAIWLQPWRSKGRPALWGNPRGFRLDGALALIVFISATIYGLVWVPDLVRQSPDPNEIHNFNDVVYRQYTMFEYHDKLRATHPYSSKWFEWPIDYVPIAYFYQDHRSDIRNPNGCCVQEITSMPNPFNMWLGLLSVPIVGVLAWRRKHKGYALIVLTYLLQWLPWMGSPRITFAYHFYVDIPLICLCNAILFQQVWQRYKDDPDRRKWAMGGIAATVVLIAGAFIFFYPILAAVPITWNQWHARMWIPTWIIGPG